jgi:hypothetical protein
MIRGIRQWIKNQVKRYEAHRRLRFWKKQLREFERAHPFGSVTYPDRYGRLLDEIEAAQKAV